MERDEGPDAASRAITLHIGQRLRLLRRTKGLTQRAMGRIIGMTYQQFRKYETGVNVISLGKLWILASHFGLKVSYFFEGLDGAAPAREGEPGLPPAPAGRNAESHLTLELGRVLAKIESPEMLRGLLHYMRAIGDAREGRRPAGARRFRVKSDIWILL
jgi:transcriptional regulator with XRE-family HTH domain